MLLSKLADIIPLMWKFKDLYIEKVDYCKILERRFVTWERGPLPSPPLPCEGFSDHFCWYVSRMPVLSNISTEEEGVG